MWAYAVIGPDGSTIGPLAQQPFVPYLSDEFYASFYDDLKQKYQSPLITTDGTDKHRVWLFRYDTENVSGAYPFYPIVWESVDGHATSSPDASTVLAASTPITPISAPVSVGGGAGPVTIGGGPTTITSTGVAPQTDPQQYGQPTSDSTPSEKTAGLLLLIGAAAGTALIYFWATEPGGWIGTKKRSK